MAEPSSNRLMRRIMRFIEYNTACYIHHRIQHEYMQAVDRLRKLNKLVEVIKEADRQGKCELSWNDWTMVRQVRCHVATMFGATVAPIPVPEYPQPALL